MGGQAKRGYIGSTTFCVCYGKKNGLYANLMHIYEILKEDTVAQASLAFTSIYCCQIRYMGNRR